MSLPASSHFPVFNTSAFAVEGREFTVDLVRLEDRPDIPRSFPHRHDYYHLLWMSEASGTHLLDFERHEARANTVFFVSPGQLHAWESTIRPRGFVINFSADFLVQLFPRADGIAQVPFFHTASTAPVLHMTQEQHDALHPLLLEIEREFRSSAEACMDIVRAYLLVLLTRLRRIYPHRSEEPTSVHAFSLTHRFRLLVEQHYLDYERLGDYASSLHTTERQLNDAVKRSLGKTAGQLIQDRLVMEAKRLLSNTAMGVAEVAFHLHFDDHAYFSRFFKKHAGMTPMAFKKRHAAMAVDSVKPPG